MLVQFSFLLFQAVLNREESPNNTTSPRQFTSPPQSPPSSPPITNNIQSANSIPSTNQNSVHGHVVSPVAKPLPNQIQGAPAAMNSFQTGVPTVITGTAPTNIHTGHHHHRINANSTHDPVEGWALFEDDEHAGILTVWSCVQMFFSWLTSSFFSLHGEKDLLQNLFSSPHLPFLPDDTADQWLKTFLSLVFQLSFSSLEVEDQSAY